jgi:hypothetical protein
MYLLGHTDPTLTMAVYQQVLDLGGAAIKTLERLLGARLDEVGQILCGVNRRPIGHRLVTGAFKPLDSGPLRSARRSQIVLISRQNERALFRTRTGDPFLTMEVLYQLS